MKTSKRKKNCYKSWHHGRSTSYMEKFKETKKKKSKLWLKQGCEPLLAISADGHKGRLKGRLQDGKFTSGRQDISAKLNASRTKLSWLLVKDEDTKTTGEVTLAGLLQYICGLPTLLYQLELLVLVAGARNLTWYQSRGLGFKSRNLIIFLLLPPFLRPYLLKSYGLTKPHVRGGIRVYVDCARFSQVFCTREQRPNVRTDGKG